MIKPLKLSLLILVTLTAISIWLPGNANAATYDNNRIIDDSVFNQTNSMGAAQIDAFLNSFPNSCISPNSGFAALVPNGYRPSVGYSYGSYTTAGNVIATSAQTYGINPRVLLVTLQKEQSLVAGRANYCNNGDEHKYAAAVGYGCPDGGTRYNYTNVNLYSRNGAVHSTVGPTCVNSAAKAGFSQQVIRAAWLLKFGQQRAKGNIGWAVVQGPWDNTDDPETCYGGPMTKGSWRVCPSGPTIFYDGLKTIDGVAVRMATGATAALYWYTPHFHGNQNFFNTYVDWFGLPYANDTDTPHPNGTVISDGARVYLVENGTKRHIVTPNIFTSYRYNWSDVRAATTGDNELPVGAPLDVLAPGTLFTLPDGSVYLADYFGGALKKQWVSADTFLSLGYRWDQIVHTSPSESPTATQSGFYAGSRHPAGATVVVPSEGRVYVLDQASKHHIVNGLAFESNDYDWSKVLTATTGDIALVTAAPADTRQGTILISSGGIFVIDYDANGIFKRPVGPWECYADQLHYTPQSWRPVGSELLPARTGSLFTC